MVFTWSRRSSHTHTHLRQHSLLLFSPQQWTRYFTYYPLPSITRAFMSLCTPHRDSHLSLSLSNKCTRTLSPPPHLFLSLKHVHMRAHTNAGHRAFKDIFSISPTTLNPINQIQLSSTCNHNMLRKTWSDYFYTISTLPFTETITNIYKDDFQLLEFAFMLCHNKQHANQLFK